MKKPDLLFSLVLVPLDFLALLLAAFFTYYLRFSALVNLRPIIYEIPFSHYFIITILISCLWLPIFGLAGLYRDESRREIVRIFFACTVGVMGIILFIFFQQELFSSRFIILAAWPISIFSVWLLRKIFRAIRRFVFKKSNIRQKVVLVGQHENVEEIKQFIKFSPDYFLIDWATNSNLITKDYLKDHKNNIDELIIIDSSISKEEKMRLLSICDQENIPFRYVADQFDATVKNIGFEFFFGLPLIAIKRTPLDGWGRVAKRLTDLCISFLAMIILSPILLIISLLIKLDSTGPVFVHLKRVGKKGKIFNLVKFRSMIDGAENQKKALLSFNERKGPLFKMKNDPRVTKFGKFLRKTSIDEIPQFINVLKGQMSLVGPRPHEPGEVDQYEKHQKKLLFIKPGITGLAQLSGRANISFEDEAGLDIYYIENWSFWKDVEIFIKTIPLVIFRRGAV